MTMKVKIIFNIVNLINLEESINLK